MKKARANTNDYWDKKLLEVEEKDPNRWRHTGYKKMYIEGESSSESDRESFRYNRVYNFYLFIETFIMQRHIFSFILTASMIRSYVEE